MYKYYKYENAQVGTNYFRVGKPTQDVLKITSHQTLKLGRPYCIGVTFVKYNTWITKYAWDIELKRNFPEITKEEFDKVLDEMCAKFKHL